MSITIDTEPRINKSCKLGELLPLLRLQARLTGSKLNTRKGLKKVLRDLNRAINLN